MAGEAPQMTGSATSGNEGGGADGTGEQRAPVSREARRANVDQARRDAAAKHGRTPAKPAFDPRREAAKAVKERKAGSQPRLATVDGEQVEDFRVDDGVDPDPKDAHAREPAKPKAQPEPEEQPKDGEEQTSWAKKLKARAEKAEQTHAAREQEFERISAEVEKRITERDAAIAAKTYEVEDLSHDLKVERHLVTQLLQLINKVAPGKFVQESLDKVRLNAENAKLRRHQERGAKVQQGEQTRAQTAAMHTQIRGEIDSFVAKYPELAFEGDGAHNKAARGFWETWLKSGARVDGIEAQIETFVAAQRWRAAQANKKPGAQQRPPRGDDAPPDSQGLAGAGVGAAAQSLRPGAVTRGSARKLLRDFHSAQGARR